MRLDSLRTDVETTGGVKAIRGGISEKSLPLLVDMLSNQIYSDPLGSIVRELVSNCFDAHIQLQKRTGFPVEDAVIVKYSETEGEGYIHFIDFGIGMNPEKVEEVYLQILESDKREDDDAIGGFGMGGKSFLSYTDSIELTTRFDGREYFYIVGKNEEGEFGAYLLDERDTELKNGSEIKMGIGEVPYFGKANDFNKFKKAIQEQLTYFDNVYLDGWDLENDWKVFEGSTFKWRAGGNPFKQMHIILGKVAYPIDWSILGIEEISFPVGVKFDIGELKVTISREQIRYTESSKELIKSRIEACIDEVRELFNKQGKEVETLAEYYKLVNTKDKFLLFKDNDNTEFQLSLPKVKVWNEKKAQYEFKDQIKGLRPVVCKLFSHLPITIPKDPFFFFEIKGRIVEVFPKKDAFLDDLPRPFNQSEIQGKKSNVYEAVANYQKSVYRLKEGHKSRNKLIDKYIFWKEHIQAESYPILLSINKFRKSDWEILFDDKKVTKKVTHPDGEKSTVHVYPPVPVGFSKAKIIKEYRRIIIKEVVSMTQSYDKQVPSPAYLSWVQLQKLGKRTRTKIEGTISIYDVENAKASTLDLKTLQNYTGFIIFGTREQAGEVRQIRDFLNCNDRRNTKDARIQKFFTTGSNNIKTLLSIPFYHKGVEYPRNPYYMSVEEFKSGHNRLFKNIVTAWYVNEKLNSARTSVGSELFDSVKFFNEDLAARIQKLRTWTYRKHTGLQHDHEFRHALYKVGQENGLLWNHLIKEADEIAEWFSGLSHYKHTLTTFWLNSEWHKDFLLILKARGKRIGKEHYLAKEQPKVILEGVNPVENEQLELNLDNQEEVIELEIEENDTNLTIELLDEEQQSEEENNEYL